MRVSVTMTVRLLALICISTGVALAHSVSVTWEACDEEISVKAAWDDGLPMVEAQVAVFSPLNPASPFLSGKTDDEGIFIFKLDDSHGGVCDVQVRKAGHGEMIHIDLSIDEARHGGASVYTTGQILLMAVCVIWGFAGTAFFFHSRKKRKPDAYT